jgi:hypothetical protein
MGRESTGGMAGATGALSNTTAGGGTGQCDQSSGNDHGRQHV